jgi:hypothetical protein
VGPAPRWITSPSGATDGARSHLEAREAAKEVDAGRKDHKCSQEWKSTRGGQCPGLTCWDLAFFCDSCGSKEAGVLPQETQKDAKGGTLVCPDSTFAIINDNGFHREE